MTQAQMQDILHLPVPERLRIAEAIWDSLEEDHDSLRINDRERELLDQRLDAFLADPEDMLTWPEVKARLTRRA